MTQLLHLQLFNLQNEHYQKTLEYNTLLEEKNQKTANLKELTVNVQTKLGPELKQYHGSRVNISKRGGGGGQAMKNFMIVKDEVEQALKGCGYTKVKCNTGDRINRGYYNKNNYTHSEFVIHFRLRTNLGRIVNVIVQTQSESGGAYTKASFYIDTMAKHSDEIFIFFLKTTIESVKTKVDNMINATNGLANVSYFNDLHEFQRYIELL